MDHKRCQALSYCSGDSCDGFQRACAGQPCGEGGEEGTRPHRKPTEGAGRARDPTQPLKEDGVGTKVKEFLENLVAE